MKIVHSISILSSGIFSSVVQYSASADYAKALPITGHDVRVITTNAGLPHFPKNKLGKLIIQRGVKVTYFPVDYSEGTIRSKAFEQALPEALRDIDLLHLSTVWHPLGISIQRQAWKQCIPVFQSLRGALGPYSRRQRWWKKYPYYLLRERPWLQRAAALHVTTRQEEREFKRF